MISIEKSTWIVFITCVMMSCGEPRPHLEKTNDPVVDSVLSTFQLEDGFKIELVAMEPLISDPVAVTIAEDGLMYVLEMHGYPLDKSGSGKIKILTDSNDDGRMDRSAIFADSLILPTGIMRWNKGLLITDPPSVYYLEDSNGDGRADKKETVLTGFAVSNPQHNVNNPLLSIDNWIYLGHEGAVSTKKFAKEFGDPGSTIRYPGSDQAPRLEVNGGGRSVRFRPDELLLENTSSYTQFGHTFDNWGNHFLVANANHIFHEMIAAKYLRRNPELLISSASSSISDHLDAAEVFPITNNPENQMLTDIGVITSACGLTYYAGGAFPEKYNNVTFVAEPVSNLIHADVVTPSGTDYKASRLTEKKEFLASTDAWFRPVNMHIGPDGALYVVDYYRQIIEHPEWLSEDVIKSGALYNGTDKGRIFRISRKDAAPVQWSKVKMDKMSVPELVSKLEDPNIWWRGHAQRLLIDRNATESVELLTKLAETSTSPFGRLHALWTLDGLHKLPGEMILTALQDEHAGIRVNAIRLAEKQMASYPQLQSALLGMVNDKDPKARYQLLCTLGSVKGKEATEARRQLLFKNIDDRWMQVAALSASATDNDQLLQTLISDYQPRKKAYADLIERVASMLGANRSEPKVKQLMLQAIRADKDSGWPEPLLNGLAKGLALRKRLSADYSQERSLLVDLCLNNNRVSIKESSIAILKRIGLTAGQYSAALSETRKIIKDSSRNVKEKSQGIAFLSLARVPSDIRLFKSVVTSKEEIPVQLAALRALSERPEHILCDFVLKRWPSIMPDVREAAIGFILRHESCVSALLKAVETGSVPIANISWPISVQLMSMADPRLRARATALFASKTEATQKLIKEYGETLKMNGSVSRGKQIFQQSCGLCHQVRGKFGVQFGPDLGTVNSWAREGLLANILDPNLSISDGYDLWEIQLTNGQMLQAVIMNETPTAITIKSMSAPEQVIARANIASSKMLGISAMPSGLEKTIDKQGMADLLAFLKQAKQ